MKFFHNNNILASLLFLLISINSAFAIITHIQVPSILLRPGHKFTVKFFTENHIIQNAQYYVIFGLQPGTTPPPGSNVGEFVLTSPQGDLVEGHHSVTGHGSFTVDVTLPKNFPVTGKTEKFVLTAAALQTAGALNGAGVVFFNGIVTIASH
ncbi:uncharacterized protein EI90DRAFT_3157140 [Cantharellus anzutake]|uniref:uncharacterized protein n=1 Tax=Cantharellus anzutake TaxID=1750568 RepID=UPI0019071FD8|nr:uncharacterized protein EI90DRAFT_3157140 [Cantharellus anzutake]KAF8324989.1 hypothetical protein EI90DRAFT_3157140 [Cantharellus anzutake]